jgi:hypothetical protein
LVSVRASERCEASRGLKRGDGSPVVAGEDAAGAADPGADVDDELPRPDVGEVGQRERARPPEGVKLIQAGEVVWVKRVE